MHRRTTVSNEESSNQSAVNAANAWNASIIDEFRSMTAGRRPIRRLTSTSSAHDRSAHTCRTNQSDDVSQRRRQISSSLRRPAADTNPDWFHNLVAEP